MQDFRKLDVWAVAPALPLSPYQTTKSFPDFEKFGLGNQLRRAASTIAINIAESCGAGQAHAFLARQIFAVVAAEARWPSSAG